MANLTDLDRIAIGTIVVYVPALAVAVTLALRHGFGRNAGWLFLVVFSVARILGSALQLATINDPTNVGLIVGAATLLSIGISALVLVMLALIGRVLGGIARQGTGYAVVEPRTLRLVQLVVLVGLILGIVGGTKLGDAVSKAFDGQAQGQAPPAYSIPAESKAGLGLLIAGYAILVGVTLAAAAHVGHVAAGERRLLLAVGLALPFLLVRIVFSAMATFGSDPNFRSFGGSPNYPHYLIGMAIVMEMATVAIIEAVGLTLQKASPAYNAPAGRPADEVEMTGRQRDGGGSY
ncbi:hypothetical protein B0T24DRAFT_190916 [Lasiosphaeria ovina]|uniref:DUF7702 domain-containing protein n=1 Tax=Lasiosphaeria ovina TaxID=92902 RepID=A0AAE0NF17_9PEZI|nr:hypothetical protein B0T24DRAFT_190916 [Lasiosphaeria ovina]